MVCARAGLPDVHVDSPTGLWTMQSVLRASRQLWRLVAAVVVVLLASVVFYDASKPVPAVFANPAFLILAAVASGAALIWALWSVRCPKCQARWFWIAATTQSAWGQGDALLRPTRCPRCGLTSEQLTSRTAWRDMSGLGFRGPADPLAGVQAGVERERASAPFTRSFKAAIVVLLVALVGIIYITLTRWR